MVHACTKNLNKAYIPLNYTSQPFKVPLCGLVVFTDMNTTCISGADPGLILGCYKILQKKIEHRNDVICRKIIDSARSKKVQF